MNEERRICDALPASAAAHGKLVRPLQGREADGHTLIALSLQELGIKHVYAVGGIPIHETLSACAAASGLAACINVRVNPDSPYTR